MESPFARKALLKPTKTSDGAAVPVPPSPTDFMMSPASRAVKRHRARPVRAPRQRRPGFESDDAGVQYTGVARSALSPPAEASDSDSSDAASAAADATAPKIVLGSSSYGRRLVMQRAGWEVECIAPNIDEKRIRHPDPMKLPLLIAHAKADAVEAQLPPGTLAVCGDQIALFAGAVLEKPDNAAQARKMLRQYRNSSVQTVSAIVVLRTGAGVREEGVHVARVHFGDVPDSAIDAAIKAGLVMECCGSFAIDDPNLAPYVTDVQGGEDSVLGMPLGLLQDCVTKVNAATTGVGSRRSSSSRLRPKSRLAASACEAEEAAEVAAEGAALDGVSDSSDDVSDSDGAAADAKGVSESKDM